MIKLLGFIITIISTGINKVSNIDFSSTDPMLLLGAMGLILLIYAAVSRLVKFVIYIAVFFIFIGLIIKGILIFT